MLFRNESRINGFRCGRIYEPSIDLAPLFVVQVQTANQFRDELPLLRVNLEIRPGKGADELQKKQPFFSGEFAQELRSFPSDRLLGRAPSKG